MVIIAQSTTQGKREADMQIQPPAGKDFHQEALLDWKTIYYLTSFALREMSVGGDFSWEKKR